MNKSKFLRKKFLNAHGGITLVALVVTIIVLLILAAVSLSLVAGSDGLLNRASNAVDKTTEAEIIEDIELAVAQLKTDYYYEKYISNPTISGNFATYLAGKLGEGITTAKGTIELDGTTVTYTNTKTNVETQGTFDSATGTIRILGKTIGTAESTTPAVNPGNEDPGEEPETTYTITYSAGGGTGSMENTTVTAGNSVNLRTNTFEKEGYTFNGWSDGTNSYTDGQSVTPEGNLALTAQWTVAANPIATFGEVNTAFIDYFGRLTDYSAAQGSNWRLFYADSNYAYLISDSIGDYTLNNSTLFSDFSTATMGDLGKNLNPKCSNAFWTNNAGNNNVKGIAGLLNTSKWTDYANSSKGAQWAIGAPTLEMFIASYNATHSSTKATSLGVSNIQLDSQVASDTAYGYQVKKGSENFENYTTGLQSSSNLDYVIYCPPGGKWWLASPCAYGFNYVMRVSDAAGRVS